MEGGGKIESEYALTGVLRDFPAVLVTILIGVFVTRFHAELVRGRNGPLVLNPAGVECKLEPQPAKKLPAKDFLKEKYRTYMIGVITVL